jgi:hypothetical protein
MSREEGVNIAQVNSMNEYQNSNLVDTPAYNGSGSDADAIDFLDFLKALLSEASESTLQQILGKGVLQLFENDLENMDTATKNLKQAQIWGMKMQDQISILSFGTDIMNFQVGNDPTQANIGVGVSGAGKGG